VSFLIIVPAAAHLLFSWRGLNPTDDGFVLALSRRILEGQVPHRDFISIRPAGSAFLHAPFVLFGGDRTFWVSRSFVWFQFACIAWAWAAAVGRLSAAPFGAVEKAVFGLVAFAYSSHAFPVMAWQTIDGLFFLSIGLVLCLGTSRGGKTAGYALIGMSCLCKQSFLPMTFAVVILGDWRLVRYWLAMALPGAAYFAYLAGAGAVPDAVVQMGAHAGTVPGQMGRYLFSRVALFGAAWGYASLALAFGHGSLRTAAQKDVPILAGALMLFGALSVISAGLKDVYTPFWALFGITAGAVLFLVSAGTEPFISARAGALALLAAWCASLSVGYRTPALASGALAAAVLGYGRDALRHAREMSPVRKLAYPLLIVVLAVTMAEYGIVRNEHIYRDRPARELRFSLDGLLPGGRHIRTNENTFRFLADLKAAIGKAGGKAYAVIPDVAGYWARSQRTNPLPVDWAQGTELASRPLVDRVTQTLEAGRGDIAVIAQKVEASLLADGFVPLRDSDHYAVVRFVRDHFTKTAETEFFDIYE